MSLKRAAASGMKWSSASMVLVTLLQLAKYFVLARFLAPEDFGLMAIVIVSFSFGFAFSDVGLNKALIHFKDTTLQQRSTLYWLNIGAGALLTAIQFVLAPFVVYIFGEPRLVELLRVASFAFVISTFGQQFQMLLTKELQFRTIAIINVASVALGTSLAILLAALGQGVWALLWASLSTFMSKAFWYSLVGIRRWPVRFIIKIGEVKKYISFGLYQLGTRITLTFYNSSDTMLIGAVLGTEVLGYYTMALNLAIIPISKLIQVFSDVMFPILNKINEEVRRLRNAFYRVYKLIMIVSFPLMFGLMSIASTMVPVILGEKWLPSVPLIQILSVVALIRSSGSVTGPLLLAKGRADMIFRWHISVAFVHITGVIIGLNWGTTGVAVALLILQFCYLLSSYVFLIRPNVGPSFNLFIVNLLQPLTISLVMLALVISLPVIFPQLSIMLLVSQIILGAVIYLGLTFYFQREEVRELSQLLLNR